MSFKAQDSESLRLRLQLLQLLLFECHAIHEIVKVLAPARSALLSVLHPLVAEQLLDGPALVWVSLEASADKVAEGFRVLGARYLWHFFVHQKLKYALGIPSMLEKWRVAECEFDRQAPECPYVNLFRVVDALGDLRRDKVDCASLGISVLLLLAQEDAEAHVANFDGAVWLVENVVRLYVAVKDVLVVHGK